MKFLMNNTDHIAACIYIHVSCMLAVKTFQGRILSRLEVKLYKYHQVFFLNSGLGHAYSLHASSTYQKCKLDYTTGQVKKSLLNISPHISKSNGCIVKMKYNLKRWDRSSRYELWNWGSKFTQSLRVTKLPVICVCLALLLAWFSLWYHRHLKLISKWSCWCGAISPFQIISRFDKKTITFGDRSENIERCFFLTHPVQVQWHNANIILYTYTRMHGHTKTFVMSQKPKHILSILIFFYIY